MIPKILYSASNLCVPNGFVQELNRVLFQFIWGKTDRIKRNVLANVLTEGGLKMVDVESLFESVKASWIPRILNADVNDVWTTVCRYYLDSEFTNLYFKLNFTVIGKLSMLEKVPLFYKDALIAFNKAKCISREYFCNNILDQPLWANDFITCSSKGKETVLYYKRWIDANIVKVKNLRFIDGILDENYIYRVVRCKTDILAEVTKLKLALNPYKDYIGNNEPDIDTYLPLFIINGDVCDDFKSCKSKFFYDCLRSLKCELPTGQIYWSDVLDLANEEFSSVYKNKISGIKEKKLSEFNYKVLHNILPCNTNLVRWQKKDEKNCRLCNVEESIEHMLFHCIDARSVWEDFKNVTGIDVTLKHVITGDSLTHLDNLQITVVAYLIYKRWLLESKEIKQRLGVAKLNDFNCELRHRANLYREIGWLAQSISLQSLIANY